MNDLSLRIARAGTVLLAASALTLAGATAATAVEGTTPPVVQDDFYAMVQGQTMGIGAPGVLFNDFAPGGEQLNVFAWDGYNPAELTPAADGSFMFTPDPSFTGQVTFTYQAQAGTAVAAPATVHISVDPAPPIAPVGTPDMYFTPVDAVLTVAPNGVLANDVGGLAVVDLKDQPVGLTANFDGGFTYTPPAGFIGTVGFSYRMSVGSDMLSDWIPVTINVTPRATVDTPDETPEETPTDLETLAYTGEASGWLVGPAAALLGFGALAVWYARRRTELS